MWKVLAFLFCINFWAVCAQFEVPDAIVEAYTPSGFKVSIPAVDGIKLFAFHGKINEEMDLREAGTFSVDVNKPVDGRWSYFNKNTKLKVGDVLYYWTYVIHQDGRGFEKLEQSFTVEELIPRPGATTTTTTPKPTRKNTKKPTTTTTTTTTTTEKMRCEPSLTTINSGKSVCSKHVIFQDNFNGINAKRWEIQHQFAGEPDYEYVLYQNDPANVHSENNLLFIKPTLFEERYGVGAPLQKKEFDLGIKCTARGQVGETLCKRTPQAAIILPPVISGRIHTRNSFSFVYGTIEIRAKLPKGNWIYPELYLVPRSHLYGSEYKSGEMRVALTFGNEGLRQKLHGGVILGSSEKARSFGLKVIEKSEDLSSDFHIYSLKWQPEIVTLAVDGTVYGNVEPPFGGFSTLEEELRLEAANLWREGGTFAPFDQEMYITLGVGVGGFAIPDIIENKPYKNRDPKAERRFFDNQAVWNSTWDTSSQLVVDYVKVYAL